MYMLPRTADTCLSVPIIIIIIIMYIYHALINTLSAHMIHINLNMIFYTHVEHSPTKTIYIKYYTEKKGQKTRTTPPPPNTHTHAPVTTDSRYLCIYCA